MSHRGKERLVLAGMILIVAVVTCGLIHAKGMPMWQQIHDMSKILTP